MYPVSRSGPIPVSYQPQAKDLGLAKCNDLPIQRF